MRGILRIFVSGIIMLLALGLTACGSSSSSSGSGGSSGPTVSGTAASGAPIAAATVTLKDAAGNSTTGTTGSDGSFSISVSGMTAPFLLAVTSGSTTYYSVASASNTTANLDPYGSLLLQAYYTAQGSTVGTAFGGTLGSSSFPSAQQLAALEQPLVTALQPYLSHAGVTQPSTYNPYTTTFSANHTGVDQVLDRTSINANLLSLSVDNGSGSTAGPLSTDVSLTFSAGSGSTLPQAVISIASSNSSNSSSSSSVQDVPVGTPTQQSDLTAALSGITTLFQNLHTLAASKGNSLATSDVTPYIDGNFLDQGQSQGAFASNIVQFLSSAPAGSSMTVSALRINKFVDSASRPTLDVTLKIAITPTTGPTQYSFLDENDNPAVGMVFVKESNGTWEFYGQQTAVEAHIDVTQTSFNDPNTSSTTTNTLDMQAQVQVAPGVLATSGNPAVVSGPADSLPNCPGSGSSTLNQSSVNLVQDSGTFDGGQDRFDLPCSMVNAGALTGVPTAGTAYNFALTLAGSTVDNQAYVLNSATNDNGVLTTVNGSALATFAGNTHVSSLAGTTVTLAFTPPTTYPLLYSFISAFCQNATEESGGGGTDISGTVSDIPPGTNTGTVAIPSQCDGSAPATLGLSVYFIGVNGERSQITQNVLH